MNTNQKRIATCMCKALSVMTEGPPMRVSICHCLDCKTRSGSAFAYQARWEDQNIKIQGQYNTFVRVHEDGDQVRFHFCPQCGSNVFYQIESMPGITAVAVGGFKDPEFPAPEYSVYEVRKHRWIALTDRSIEHYD